MVKYVFITTANLLFIVAAANLLGLRVNTTESYPEGIYRLVSDDWNKSDLVEACLPNEVRDFAISRGYIKENGRCDGHPSIIKNVMGVEGDQITITDGIEINGVGIQDASIRRSDMEGRALTATNDTVVEPGEVWLMSTHSEVSFDSRYFGAVGVENVLGKLEPLWEF